MRSYQPSNLTETVQQLGNFQLHFQLTTSVTRSRMCRRVQQTTNLLLKRISNLRVNDILIGSCNHSKGRVVDCKQTYFKSYILLERYGLDMAVRCARFREEVVGRAYSAF